MKLTKLLDQAKKHEDELRSFTKHASVFNPRVVTLREKVKSAYWNVLLMDYKLAQSHGVAHKLWRTVFYNPIEQLRKKQRAEDASASSSTSKKETSARTMLVNFLNQADQFYRHLIRNLQRHHGDAGVLLPGEHYVPKAPRGSRKRRASGGMLPNAKTKNGEKSNCYSACHLSLIFLGDVLRYAAQAHSKQEPVLQKNFKHSGFCYRQAAYIWPKSGNPHNQLAVLSIYSQDDVGAVYHYCRALHAEAPFRTASENIGILLDKVRSRYGSVLQTGRFSLSHCTLHFLQATSVLFMRRDFETYDKAYQSFLCHFKQLCLMSNENQKMQMHTGNHKDFKDSHVAHFFIRIVTISLCNIQSAIDSIAGQGDEQGTAQDVLSNEFVQNALVFAFAIQVNLLQSVRSSAEGTSSVCLPAIRVFSSWIVSNSDKVDFQDAKSAQLMNKFRKYSTALLDMLRSFEEEVSNNVKDNSCCLLEDVELRGFKPIAQSQDGIDYEVWQVCAQRPLESNFRKRVRVLRLMEDARIIFDDPGLFKRETQPPEVEAEAQRNVEEEEQCNGDEGVGEFIVWKGCESPENLYSSPNVFPEVCDKTVLGDKRGEAISRKAFAFIQQNS
mmetsp:Transcript_12647/g.32067  ORF Transcript_12647/g.32067 Transcript_12647/m.32067 type:complete len:611 (+) Transcript_12647:219-2051(+)